jgi:hypothetical protein
LIDCVIAGLVMPVIIAVVLPATHLEQNKDQDHEPGIE